MPSEDLSKFINAFDDPYEGASTMINGNVVRLKGAIAWWRYSKS